MHINLLLLIILVKQILVLVIIQYQFNKLMLGLCGVTGVTGASGASGIAHLFENAGSANLTVNIESVNITGQLIHHVSDGETIFSVAAAIYNPALPGASVVPFAYVAVATTQVKVAVKSLQPCPLSNALNYSNIQFLHAYAADPTTSYYANINIDTLDFTPFPNGTVINVDPLSTATQPINVTAGNVAVSGTYINHQGSAYLTSLIQSTTWTPTGGSNLYNIGNGITGPLGNPGMPGPAVDIDSGTITVGSAISSVAPMTSSYSKSSI